MEQSAPKTQVPVEEGKDPAEIISPQEKNKSRKSLVIVASVIILGIVLLSFAIYFFNFQKSNIQTTEEVVFTGEIVLGYNADQSTGATAPFGVWGAQGFQIAVDEVNARGGFLGKKIIPIILDDKADKEISKKNVEKLIFEDEALAIIGPGNSANALYWLDIPQENETIVISHIATATEITQRYAERPRNYIFGIRSLDKEQVRLFIAWLLSETNNGKIAIVHDSTGYGLQGLKDVSEVLERWGKVPVFTKSFDPGTNNSELIKIFESAKNLEADGIVFYSLADSTASLLKALDEVEDYNPVLVGTAANSAGLWELAGPLAERLVFGAPVTSKTSKEAEILNAKIIEKYGKAPAILSSAASGYDSVIFLENAVNLAGTLDRTAVRDALENIESVQGIKKLFVKPFSKNNHDALIVTDTDLSRWVNGEITKIDINLSELEIR